MSPVPCRDCGALIDPEGRGCGVCARNLDAERMLGRWLLTALFVLALAAAVVVYLVFGER